MFKINNCSAVVLCGGKSKRMGFDKALLKVDGEYILKLTSLKLKTMFSEVILVADKKEKLSPIDGLLDCVIVEDNYVDCGPLGGICTGFEVSKNPYIFVIACDMPIIEESIIKKMYNKLSNEQALLCLLDNYIEPMHAFYNRSSYIILKNQVTQNELSIQKSCSKLSITKYLVDDNEKKVFFHNLNSPLDFKNYVFKRSFEPKKFQCSTTLNLTNEKYSQGSEFNNFFA